MKEKDGNIKQLVMGMAAYTSASILGPLIIFGGIGMFLDKVFEKNSLYTIISLIIAFFITNLMLFRKVKKLSTLMTEYGEEAKKKKEEDEKVKKELDNNDIEKGD